MKQIKLSITSLVFCLSILPVFAQNPYNADIVVAQDGSGNYTTLQAAINAVTDNDTRRTVIYIKRGKYDTEKLIIPANKKNITMIGESRDETVISYHMYDCTNPQSENKCPPEAYELWKHNSDLLSTSATLTILADGFIAENLTIENTAGPVGQALAITVQGDRNNKIIFRNCNFLGYQDTIYLRSEGIRSYFENCLILGRTDYIYGGGIGFFQSCEIRSYGGGYITAPSTVQNQAYGFVFYQCKVTYADGSPRNGDDGTKFALGRPWHNYPKVSWLYCEMTDMLNPLGWPTTWNMDYASTSTELKLYEYKNTGAGADMSGRAKWAGLRAMTDLEALDYTAQKVMAGNDGWDPTAEVSTVKSYTWVGTETSKSWLNTENWNPAGLPVTGELATVEGDFTIFADGGNFTADLNLNQGAKLNVTANSTVTYLALAGGEINASSESAISGRIQTKTATELNISTSLDVKATLGGVHPISKKGSGDLILSGNNNSFFGNIEVAEGTLNANAANSIGYGNTTVKNNATLVFNADNAFSVKSVLKIENGGKVTLNSAVVLNELYINGVMLIPGVYNAITHPEVFSGSANITVGRPTKFVWNPTESKTWENPNNYKPALLPLTGDSVIVEIEMEINANLYSATILLQKANLRFRANATSTSDIVMSDATSLSYATSGQGFSLTANVKLIGNVTFQMSAGTSGGYMEFLKSIEGNDKIVTVHNSSGNQGTVGKVVLSGDNSNFAGIWNVTRTANAASSSAAIEGKAENAFGKGNIDIGNRNIVYFSHAKASGAYNTLILATGAKSVMNTNATVGKLILGTDEYTSGTFNVSSHPNFFEGTGTLIVNATSSVNKVTMADTYFDGHNIKSLSKINSIKVYSINGQCIEKRTVYGHLAPLTLNQGLYIVEVNLDSENIFIKIVI